MINIPGFNINNLGGSPTAATSAQRVFSPPPAPKQQAPVQQRATAPAPIGGGGSSSGGGAGQQSAPASSGAQQIGQPSAPSVDYNAIWNPVFGALDQGQQTLQSDLNNNTQQVDNLATP